MVHKARSWIRRATTAWFPATRPASIAAGDFRSRACAFTFDNIAGRENKARILRDLGCLLTAGGDLVLIVLRPEI